MQVRQALDCNPQRPCPPHIHVHAPTACTFILGIMDNILHCVRVYASLLSYMDHFLLLVRCGMFSTNAEQGLANEFSIQVCSGPIKCLNEQTHIAGTLGHTGVSKKVIIPMTGRCFWMTQVSADLHVSLPA